MRIPGVERGPVRRAVVGVAVMAAALAVAPGALAQTATTTAPATTTTTAAAAPTTSTAPPTAATAPSTTTTTTAPASATTTTVPPSGGDPLASESDPPVAVPAGVVAVPPRATPRAPTAVDAALAQALAQQAAQAQASLSQAVTAANAADARVAAVEAKVAAVQHQVDGLRSVEQDAIWKLAAARSRLARRAVAAYVGGAITPLTRILQAGDLNQLDRDLQIEDEASRGELAAVKTYEAARRTAGTTADSLATTMDGLSAELAAAQAAQTASHQQLAQNSGLATAANLEPGLVNDGFVFPVLGPHVLDKNFGDPRDVGTPYFHLHQGDDVEAPQGAPLVAVVRGVVVNISSSTLGGNGLWLQGQDGTKYYYAHLSAYAPNLAVGQLVDAGQLVGLVGATGDATGPHLHFEVHPGGGPAIDPWSLLSAVDTVEAQTQVQARTPPPDAGASTTVTSTRGG